MSEKERCLLDLDIEKLYNRSISTFRCSPQRHEWHVIKRIVRAGKGHRSNHYWQSMIAKELTRWCISTFLFLQHDTGWNSRLHSVSSSEGAGAALDKAPRAIRRRMNWEMDFMFVAFWKFHGEANDFVVAEFQISWLLREIPNLPTILYTWKSYSFRLRDWFQWHCSKSACGIEPPLKLKLIEVSLNNGIVQSGSYSIPIHRSTYIDTCKAHRRSTGCRWHSHKVSSGQSQHISREKW